MIINYNQEIIILISLIQTYYDAMRAFDWREFKYHVNFDKIYEKKPQVV